MYEINLCIKIKRILLSPEEIAVAATAPPPPPPPPVETPPKPRKPLAIREEPSPEPIKRNTSRQSIASAHSGVQEELASVLTLVRERTKSNKFLDIKQTPQTYINQESNADEVQDWLEKKGFSDTIRQKFAGIGGYEILGMKKQDLQVCCGRNEGWRLYSQLLIQKSYGVSMF